MPIVERISRRYEDIASELEPVTLADTLVVFGRTRLNKHSIELDDASRYAAFAANRLLDARAAKRIEYRAQSEEGLALLESYFDMLPNTPENSLSGGIVSGVEDEIKELKRIALNREFGSVALVTAGPVDKSIAQGLRSRGINTVSFTPQGEIDKRFVASSTSSPSKKIETARLFIRALTFKLPDLRFHKLTPIHTRV